jgi:hypothetical protein
MTPRRSRRWRTAPVLAVAAATLAACGSAPLPPPPTPVPSGLVPSTLLDGQLGLEEFSPARTTFANAGSSSLVADGRLWQLRRGATLVGTLQVATLKPTLSTAKAADRKDVLDSVLTGAPYETIDVQDVPVAQATNADRTLYVWFGAKMFEVLQLKGSKVDPDQVVEALIGAERASGQLQAVASADEEDVEPGS